jgi:ABC-type uncharacterized transport system involved in gliding motility auxiliary subunit
VAGPPVTADSVRVATPRPWRQWLLLMVSLTGLTAMLAMAQVLLADSNWRLDLTPEKRFTLSDYSRKLLSGLDQDVEIIAFLRADDPRNREIADLLERVRAASGRVRFSLVDVNRNPAVARQYGVNTYGSVVVESGPRRKEFSNPREDLLMAAILQVTRPTRKVVYFVTGHGEQELGSADRDRGYSGVRMALENEFYEVHTLSLLGEAGVPADATVLVVAGPRKDLLPGEVLKLGAYLERGGGLLALLDPEAAPTLAAFLSRYGVQLGDDVVVDPENRLFAGDYLTMVVPGLSPEHPVTAVMTAPPLFSQARSVRVIPARPGVRALEFLHAAPSSFATPDTGVLRTGFATYHAGRDQPGPVPVGVAVLATNPPPTPPARIVVFGDSEFANNFFIDYLGNKDLFVNTVNWIGGQEGLVGLRTPRRTPGLNQFFVSARQGRLAFILGTVVQPAVFLVVGLAVFVRRRWRG